MSSWQKYASFILAYPVLLAVRHTWLVSFQTKLPSDVRCLCHDILTLSLWNFFVYPNTVVIVDIDILISSHSCIGIHYQFCLIRYLRLKMLERVVSLLLVI